MSKLNNNSRTKRLISFFTALVLLNLVLLTAPTAYALHYEPHGRNMDEVLETMVIHWYAKNHIPLAKSIKSYCYFDPDVDDSMGCSWRWGSSNLAKLQQNAKKQCKQAGGNKCVRYWANGKISYKKISSELKSKLTAIQENLPNYDQESNVVPADFTVSSNFVTYITEGGLNRSNEWRKKERNRHYAMCAAENGQGWTRNYLRGRDVTSEHVASFCMLKCQAVRSFLNQASKCFLIILDGEYTSSTAEQLISQ